jgi:hypothetical protein
MNSVNTWSSLALICAWPGMAIAQLQLLPDKDAQCVFAGDARQIAVEWHNAGNQPVEAEIHAQVFQTTTATAVPLGGGFWKNLSVLPGQTILESARLDFPAVRIETKFLVQWLEGTNRLLGVTAVLIYPTNLLEGLRPLAGGKAIGIFDPQGELKPLLKSMRVDFEDLGNLEFENFSGKLAIVGPFASRSQVPSDLAKQIKKLAQKGAAVVWILPPDSPPAFAPSVYPVWEGLGMVMVVQARMVSDLPGNPRSQSNLLHCCDLALHAQFLTLPSLSAPS